MRALIYSRVSQDRAAGRSPEEQEAESRQLCDREGWTVVGVVTDSVGASRYSKGKRTGWQEVRDRLAAGEVDVLVTWEASRAQRDLKAYADLRDLCVKHGVLWSYSGRTHDLTTAEDRFKTGLDALLAEREVDEGRERTKRAMRANLAAGRPHGRRLFGYRRVYDSSTGRLIGQEPHPTEAPVVHRIYREYLSGYGINAIVSHLDADGVKTGTGAPWRYDQVHRVLTNPAYIGKRTHTPKDGPRVVVDGTWEPLIDEVSFQRARAKLEEAAARITRTPPTPRLLSAVIRCGECGGRMFVGHDRHTRKVYICRQYFHVSRDMRKLDAYVVSILLERLARSTVVDDEPPPSYRAELDELRGRKEDAIDQFTAGRISGATLAKIEAKLDGRISQLEVEVRRSLVPLDIEIPSSDLDGWWDGLDPMVRRSLVGAFVEAVTVYPTRRGSRVFDPSAIVVELKRGMLRG